MPLIGSVLLLTRFTLEINVLFHALSSSNFPGCSLPHLFHLPTCLPLSLSLSLLGFRGDLPRRRVGPGAPAGHPHASLAQRPRVDLDGDWLLPGVHAGDSRHGGGPALRGRGGEGRGGRRGWYSGATAQGTVDHAVHHVVRRGSDSRGVRDGCRAGTEPEGSEGGRCIPSTPPCPAVAAIKSRLLSSAESAHCAASALPYPPCLEGRLGTSCSCCQARCNICSCSRSLADNAAVWLLTLPRMQIQLEIEANKILRLDLCNQAPNCSNSAWI